jgi:hypothetical protein
MSKPKVPAPPPPPDPKAVAGAQTGSNVTTAISNSILGNADTSGPYGSTTNSITGYETVTDPSTGTEYQIPRFAQNTQLNAAQQGLLDQQNQLSGILNNVGIQQGQRIGGLLGQPISADGLPSFGSAPAAPGYTPNQTTFGNTSTKVQTGLGNTQNQIQGNFGATAPMQMDLGPSDFSEDRKRVEEALLSRINPDLQRDRDQLETRLINQGFVRGEQGFNDAMDEFTRQSNDARFGAVLAGGQEQSRMFGMLLQQGEFRNAAVAQDYAQKLSRAGFMNEAQAQEFAQILQRGQFANAAQEQEFAQLFNRAQFGNNATTANNNAALQNAQYGLNAAQFGNQTRQQGLQEMLALRNQPINEISALMSGGQVSLPQGQQYQAGQVQNTPIGDYYYQNANMANQQWMAQQQAATQAQAGLYGALGSLGGAGLYGLARR